MVCVLALSAVDCAFQPRSGQTKDYKIGICCFSSKHTALISKICIGGVMVNHRFDPLSGQSKDWICYLRLWSGQNTDYEIGIPTKHTTWRSKYKDTLVEHHIISPLYEWGLYCNHLVRLSVHTFITDISASTGRNDLIYGFGMVTCTVSPLSRFTAHLLPVYSAT